MVEGKTLAFRSKVKLFPPEPITCWKLDRLAPVTPKSEESKSVTSWLNSTFTEMMSSSVGDSTIKRGVGFRSPPPCPQMARTSVI